MKPRLPRWLRRLTGNKAPAKPPLPDNPYHRFYTRTRSLEELIPRPPRTPVKPSKKNP